MIRKIIQINEEKCNGCGACAAACHESAIGMVNGKAKLLRDDYCDGMGDCLPECPTGAITFVEREALAYDEAAVKENMRKKAMAEEKEMKASDLRNWPVQIKLAPVTAPYFKGAELLIAADCTAYAYASFHHDFIRGRVTLIGCPKLDGVNYSEKLEAIIASNEIKSITIVKMQVPCCNGLLMATKKALMESKKDLPCQVVTISIDGKILD